jgi:hypothetical protein
MNDFRELSYVCRTTTCRAPETISTGSLSTDLLELTIVVLKCFEGPWRRSDISEFPPRMPFR